MSQLLISKAVAQALTEQMQRLWPHFGFFSVNEISQQVSWLSQVSPQPKTHREPFLVFALETMPAYLAKLQGVEKLPQDMAVLVTRMLYEKGPGHYPVFLAGVLDHCQVGQ